MKVSENATLRSVPSGPFGRPLEAERVIDAQIMGVEVGAVGGGVRALQREHRQSLALLEVIAIERAERKGRAGRLGDRRRIGDRQQFQERAAELGQRIGGAERVARHRRQREAEPAEGGARRVEIADGKDEMIDGAGHGPSRDRESEGRLILPQPGIGSRMPRIKQAACLHRCRKGCTACPVCA